MNTQMPAPISIYLAGPIDGIDEIDAKAWRASIDAPMNVLLFDPSTCFHNTSKLVAREMNHLLRHSIVCSDGLIANLSGPGRGFGTIREIEFARSQGKPVTVACPEELEESLMTFDLMCFRTIDECLTGVLDAIQEGRSAPPFGGLMIELPGFGPIKPPPDDEEGQ